MSSSSRAAADSEARFMQSAIDKTRAGIECGQTPFGAAIAREGALVACAHNTVWQDCDPTAHAEINAIRQAARALNRIDLSGCVMFTTCEPCPMCLAAIHWAKITRVVYGATIAHAARAGFSELRVEASKLAELGGSKLLVERGPLGDECAGLFTTWKNAGRSRTY